MATTRRTAWLAGVVVGVGAGALSLVVPVIGWAIAGAFLVGVVVSRRPAAGVGGLLVGLGATWIALLAGADVRCRDFTGPGRQCIAPDTVPWLVAGVVVALIGGLATLLAARR
ncbi:MAG TPA: hypothetical protein VFP22_01085 [Candidatus Limnocylindrales bacterium]|nr:hypothetical protein [Candidatus Limnocylindrales bacterium]